MGRPHASLISRNNRRMRLLPRVPTGIHIWEFRGNKRWNLGLFKIHFVLRISTLGQNAVRTFILGMYPVFLSVTKIIIITVQSSGYIHTVDTNPLIEASTIFLLHICHALILEVFVP